MSANPTLAPSEGPEGWIPVLQLAAQEVFELMLGYPLKAQQGTASTDGLDITAMVGLAGLLCGIISIRCSNKAAASMASIMLGIDATETTPDVWDTAGEIANMIAGNFKNKIPGLGNGCMLSVPTVITGQSYHLHSMANVQVIHATLIFQDEPVVLSLEVHR
jgi:chemotaxis protein CheX